MMDNKECYFEDNTRRLIKAGFGAAMQLSPLVKEQTWQRMVSQLQTGRVIDTFSDRALMILAALLVFMATWLTGQALMDGMSAALSPKYALMALTVVCNLVCVPIACIVIVIGRRSYVS